MPNLASQMRYALSYRRTIRRAIRLCRLPEARADPSEFAKRSWSCRSNRLIHIPNITAEQAYSEREPLRVATVELAGARTLVAVPMLKEDE
jgi:hypothetical protein